MDSVSSTPGHGSPHRRREFRPAPRSRVLRLAIGTGIGALALGVLPLACGPTGQGRGPQQLDTVEVAPAPESKIDVEQDVKAPERGTTGLTGVVPADFPPDVPLYSPASITDFGDTADGRRQLTFATPDGPDKVRSWLIGRLVDLGWRRRAGASAAMEFEKGPRTVRISVQGDPVGAVYRVEY